MTPTQITRLTLANLVLGHVVQSNDNDEVEKLKVTLTVNATKSKSCLIYNR
jgi:hypothetical protein